MCSTGRKPSFPAPTRHAPLQSQHSAHDFLNFSLKKKTTPPSVCLTLPAHTSPAPPHPQRPQAAGTPTQTGMALCGSHRPLWGNPGETPMRTRQKALLSLPSAPWATTRLRHACPDFIRGLGAQVTHISVLQPTQVPQCHKGDLPPDCVTSAQQGQASPLPFVISF